MSCYDHHSILSRLIVGQENEVFYQDDMDEVIESEYPSILGQSGMMNALTSGS